MANKGAEANQASTRLCFTFNHNLSRSWLAPALVNTHGLSIKPGPNRIQQDHAVSSFSCHGG